MPSSALPDFAAVYDMFRADNACSQAGGFPRIGNAWLEVYGPGGL